MNLKKIIIYEYKILFDILDEIKEKFNFKLILGNKKNISELISELEDDYLIISNNKKEKFHNNLLISETPIKIEKLVELINLRFLKDRFNFQSDISVGSYKLNLNSRKISKNDKIVDLTEREVNLIVFLKKSLGAVKIDRLQKEVWDYGVKLETHTVETHIYRLRKKIKKEFNDDEFILSSKEGYCIK